MKFKSFSKIFQPDAFCEKILDDSLPIQPVIMHNLDIFPYDHLDPATILQIPSEPGILVRSDALDNHLKKSELETSVQELIDQQWRPGDLLLPVVHVVELWGRGSYSLWYGISLI